MDNVLFYSKSTSVFIPRANDAAAAMIRIMRVKSCQASHRKFCTRSNPRKLKRDLNRKKIISVNEEHIITPK